MPRDALQVLVGTRQVAKPGMRTGGRDTRVFARSVQSAMLPSLVDPATDAAETCCGLRGGRAATQTGPIGLGNAAPSKHATLNQVWSTLAKLWSMLVEFDQTSAKVRPNLTNIGRALPNIG